MATTEDAKYDPEQKASILGPSIGAAVPFAVGFGIAEIIYHTTGRSKYDEKCSVLGDHDLYWVYFSVVILALLTRFTNFLPGGLKNAAMKGRAKGNIRANMYLYKDEQGEIVVLDDEGAAGRYNRANRSLHHFVENAMPVFLAVPLAGYVFPLATFVLTLVFAIGRVLHQVRYSSIGYGAHAPGFVVVLLATVCLEGLVFLAALKAAGATV